MSSRADLARGKGVAPLPRKGDFFLKIYIYLEHRAIQCILLLNFFYELKKNEGGGTHHPVYNTTMQILGVFFFTDANIAGAGGVKYK